MNTAEHARPKTSADELLGLVPGVQLVVYRALGAGEDANDAVQEVLTRAITALEDGRRVSGPLGAFVYGIARHVIVDVLRARGRTILGGDAVAAAVAPEPSPLEALITEQERAAMRAALAQLDDDDRELLRRCYVNGERVADIARATSQPADRIRKRKSRAIQQLRELLLGSLTSRSMESAD